MDEKNKQTRTTHFGFRQVPMTDKARLVGEVFTSVADRYDLMNDLMSLGVHRLWKRHFVQSSGVRPGDQVLDLAGGTGDITALMNKRVGRQGRIVLADINAAMLENGRDRLLDEGVTGNVAFTQVNAETLPFASNTFNLVTMAFGLRNVTDKQAALDSIFRVLKPGGRVLILEFSRLQTDALRPVYDWYSFKVLPRIGALVTNNADSYQYLAESIRKHPDQQTLKTMMAQSNFEQCHYRNLNGGLVAIHSGVKT